MDFIVTIILKGANTCHLEPPRNHAVFVMQISLGIHLLNCFSIFFWYLSSTKEHHTDIIRVFTLCLQYLLVYPLLLYVYAREKPSVLSLNILNKTINMIIFFLTTDNNPFSLPAAAPASPPPPPPCPPPPSAVSCQPCPSDTDCSISPSHSSRRNCWTSSHSWDSRGTGRRGSRRCTLPGRAVTWGGQLQREIL